MFLPGDKKDEFLERHDGEIDGLAQHFGGYIVHVDKVSIRRRLRQFKTEHLEIGLKLLHHVHFYDQHRVLTEQRLLHRQLNQVVGAGREIIYASFGSPGTSGDELIHRYRLANNMQGATWDPKFINLSDVGQFVERQNLCFAFIDDFVGTGRQAIGTWNGNLAF